MNRNECATCSIECFCWFKVQNSRVLFQIQHCSVPFSTSCLKRHYDVGIARKQEDKTYRRSIQMNLPVNVLPSERVVLICLPRRKDFVYSKDFFRRSFIDASSTAKGGLSDGGSLDSSAFVFVPVAIFTTSVVWIVNARFDTEDLSFDNRDFLVVPGFKRSEVFFSY